MTTPLDPYSAATAAFPAPASVTPPRIMPAVTVPGGNTMVAALSNQGLQLVSSGQTATVNASPNGVITGVNPSLDANTYACGHFTGHNLTVNVSSTVPGNALVLTLGASAYRVSGFAAFHSTAAGAGGASFGWAGSAAVSAAYGYFTYGLASVAGGTHINNGSLGAANYTFSNTAVQLANFDLEITFSSGGTLIFTAAETTAGDTWTIDFIYARTELQ